MDTLRKIAETEIIGFNLTLGMDVDVYRGERLDTECRLEGSWCISGSSRKEFVEKLKRLIDEYRI